jgi:hypothetical protein
MGIIIIEIITKVSAVIIWVETIVWIKAIIREGSVVGIIAEIRIPAIVKGTIERRVKRIIIWIIKVTIKWRISESEPY